MLPYVSFVRFAHIRESLKSRESLGRNSRAPVCNRFGSDLAFRAFCIFAARGNESLLRSRQHSLSFVSTISWSECAPVKLTQILFRKRNRRLEICAAIVSLWRWMTVHKCRAAVAIRAFGMMYPGPRSDHTRVAMDHPCFFEQNVLNFSLFYVSNEFFFLCLTARFCCRYSHFVRMRNVLITTKT